MGQKKTFSTWVDEDSIKKLKYLSVDTGKSLGDLLAESIELLIKKYEKESEEPPPFV